MTKLIIDDCEMERLYITVSKTRFILYEDYWGYKKTLMYSYCPKSNGKEYMLYDRTTKYRGKEYGNLYKAMCIFSDRIDNIIVQN